MAAMACAQQQRMEPPWKSPLVIVKSLIPERLTAWAGASQFMRLELRRLDDLDLCWRTPGRILEQVLEAAESDEFNAAVSASDVSFLGFES